MKNNAFQRKLKQLEKGIPGITKRLPGVAKVEGLKFIDDNFQHEGFEEKAGQYKAWKKKKKGTKKTLIGNKRGGSLRRSWQRETKASDNRVEFTSALPYAEVHNEGGPAGRPPGFTMPERRMIGPSEALDKRIQDKFDRMAEDVFK